MAEAAAIPRASARRSGYIAGPASDWFFLIGAPLVAVVVWLPFQLTPSVFHRFGDARFGETLADGFMTVVIYSHLFIVFFRSHLNTGIFRLHRFRFVGVPLLLFTWMYVSPWALVAVGVLAVWWDVYHSSLQTFGIGRIYDMKAGNDPNLGRRLDIVWNLVMYAGPILAGASLASHLEDFESFSLVGSPFFAQVPAYAAGHTRTLTWGVIAFAVPFSVYYLYRYWRLHREGYRVSFQKVFLYVVLGFVSVFCWGFNTFGEAFFVMNFFHALQYFFLVWHMEQRNITRRFGLARFSAGPYLALALFVGIGISFGIYATGAWAGVAPNSRFYESSLLVVSIMHFWYDGFIWSVRRHQVD